MTTLSRTYDKGVVDSRDRAELAPGEMQQATGIYYKPGDGRAHKLAGRSTFGDTSTAAKVGGLALCQFDSGTDYLMALSSSAVYGATPGKTGTFASVYAMTGSGTTMDAAHARDRWYLALGSENQVLLSDGTTRAMGMEAPPEAMTHLSVTAGSILARPDASATGFTNPDNARDTKRRTFASATRKTAGTTTCTWSFAGSSGTGTDRDIVVSWGFDPGDFSVRQVGDARSGGIAQRASVTLKLEVSVNSGTTYTDVFNFSPTRYHDRNTALFSIGDSIDASLLRVKVSMVYDSTRAYAVTMQVYDIRLIDKTTSSRAVTATKLRYAYTEYDTVSGNESPPSPVLEVTDLTAKTEVVLTIPTKVNAAATQFRIYRTPDDGDITQLGRIGWVRSSQTGFTDDFTDYDVDDQPSELISYLQVEAEGEVNYYPRDVPPPPLRRITYFKGGLVGLSDENKRALFYSIPGLPESWPDVYVIESFPLEEHDTLVDAVSVGGSLIIAAKDTMIRLDEVPRTTAGVFIATPAEQIKGAPGCVGDYGMAVVSYEGRSHAAWISHEDGILVTDGSTWTRISDDINWSQFDGFTKSSWALYWLKDKQSLAFCYSSTATGTNNRYYLLHLDRSHVKNGRAKVTGPHYGAISAIAYGQVSNSTRTYSAHPTDGKVYLEGNPDTGADSSLAYNASGESPLIIKGARRYENWRSYTAIDGRLYHGDFGTGQTVTLAYQVGRDASGASTTRSQTVSVAGHQGTQVGIARAGEWHEETITHVGTGISHINNLTIRARVQGDEGEQKVVS